MNSGFARYCRGDRIMDRIMEVDSWLSCKNEDNFYIKDVRAHCYYASLLRTQIHMPRHPSSARAKQ